MAYDPYMVERIERVLHAQKISFTTKRMMGGIVFMMDDKMLCGTALDKDTGDCTLMARVGETWVDQEMKKAHVKEMDFSGRRMKDFIYILSEGIDLEEDLEYYLQLCIDFNPIAKRSKKRKNR